MGLTNILHCPLEKEKQDPNETYLILVMQPQTYITGINHFNIEVNKILKGAEHTHLPLKLFQAPK